MKQLGGVHVLETLKALVNDILFMNVLQNVGSDDRVQIRIHKIKHQVNISVVFRPNHILKPDDVFMAIQLLQEDNFPKCPLRIRGVLKSIKILLKCDNLLGAFVNGLPDNTVGSLAELLENLVLLQDMGLDFLSHIAFLNSNYN